MYSRFLVVLGVACLAWPLTSVGTQEDPTPDPADPQQAAPAGAVELTATAALVKGRVWQAAVGVPATEKDAWARVSQGDELSAGTQIRVSIRSTLVLQYGDDTVVQLKSMTLASLDELYRTETGKHSKFGLAYGALRGSVREKELRSDMVIESPTVTCSKEGTEDFEIRVMRGSLWWAADGPTAGAFLIRDVGTGQTERLSFGQLVSFFTMTTPAVRRNLVRQVVDIYGAGYLSSGEADFNLFVDSGQTVTGPGLGALGFGVIPGAGLMPLGGPGPGDISDLLGLALDQNAGLLFRQVESRFGAGPFPGGSSPVAKRLRGR